MEGDEPPTKVNGFIQHISAHPFYTFFYNEAGVRLYHCMANKGLVHCDVTGSVVASSKWSAWWCHELGPKRYSTTLSLYSTPRKGSLLLPLLRSLITCTILHQVMQLQFTTVLTAFGDLEAKIQQPSIDLCCLDGKKVVCSHDNPVLTTYSC